MCRDLSLRWVAVGVVSLGTVPCAGLSNVRPTVFTRLDFYVDWIQQVTRPPSRASSD